MPTVLPAPPSLLATSASFAPASSSARAHAPNPSESFASTLHSAHGSPAAKSAPRHGRDSIQPRDDRPEHALADEPDAQPAFEPSDSAPLDSRDSDAAQHSSKSETPEPSSTQVNPRGSAEAQATADPRAAASQAGAPAPLAVQPAPLAVPDPAAPQASTPAAAGAQPTSIIAPAPQAAQPAQSAAHAALSEEPAPSAAATSARVASHQAPATGLPIAAQPISTPDQSTALQGAAAAEHDESAAPRPPASSQAHPAPTHARHSAHWSPLDANAPPPAQPGAQQPSATAAAMHVPASTQPGEAAAPARARAAQVEHAVRLENATGQAAQADSAIAAPRSATASSSLGSAFQQALGQGESGASNAQHSLDANADEPRLPASVLRGLSAMVNQRGGIMSMRLDPPELGQLRVQMMLARGAVTAEFQVATAQAHAMLEKNLGTLRVALESQGLHVDRLVVHHAPAASQQSLRDEAGGNPNQPNRQHHDAANGESRGRHEQAPQDHDQRPGRRAADFAALMSQSPAGADLAALLAAASDRT